MERLGHPLASSGIPCGKLRVRLAQSNEDLREVQRLRFRVFNEELGEGLAHNRDLGLDVDPFDAYCDHLMVLAPQADGSERVVGTYRVLPGVRRPKEGFYSETEFDFSSLRLDWQHVVELGRGCVDLEHRKQTTMITLLYGLWHYMQMRGARYLLGCGSLPPGTSAQDAFATYTQVCAKGLLHKEHHVQPLKANQFTADASQGYEQLPPLVSMYFAFGANVMGPPAYDPAFNCYDLPLLFDMQRLTLWGRELVNRFDRRVQAGAA